MKTHTLVILLSGFASVLAFPQPLFEHQQSRALSKAVVCGGLDELVLTNVTDHGFISSPGYPGNYPNSIDPEDCGTRITTSGSLVDTVRLGFLQLRSAEGDYVQLELLDTNPDVEFTDQLTGIHDLFLPELYAANEVKVFLQSDANGTDDGFLAAYATELPNNGMKFEEEKSGQPGEYSSDMEIITINTVTGEVSTNKDPLDLDSKVQTFETRQFGFLSSPNHPGNYLNSQSISYQIVGPVGSRIAIRVLRLRFEPGYDYITISEPGVTTGSAPVYSLPLNAIYSQSNNVTVGFRSDSSNTYSGFLLAYAAVLP